MDLLPEAFVPLVFPFAALELLEALRQLPQHVQVLTRLRLDAAQGRTSAASGVEQSG